MSSGQKKTHCWVAAIAVVSLVFGGVFTHDARGAGKDIDLSKAMQWRHIGPFRGGRVTTAVGVPGEPLVYYQGPTGGGVWKTEDAGVTWKNISDGYFRTGSVGAIAVAPSDPNVVYVGMGEACIRSNFSHGDGVYKTTDAGKTWTHVGLGDSRQIGQVRIHPADPDVVYVAAVGHVSGPNEERGIFRSLDGGKTWKKVLYVDDKTGGVDLALDEKNPQVIYATMWQVIRQPWGIVERGPGSGLYQTKDGGDTWNELTNGLPRGEKGRIGVSVSRVNPQRVWALVDADDGGLFLSDDAGKSWNLVNDDFHLLRRPYYYSHVYADTQELDTVYVLTSPYMKSTDGGKNFEMVTVPHGDNHDLWIAPEDNKRLINANDGGANVSFDGGASWGPINNQPTAQFYWVTTDNRFPYRVYGAQQDNSTVSIPSRTTGIGITETDWYPVGGGESGYIAPHPDNPDIVYAGSYWGLLTRHDHKTGETRNISVWPEMPLGRTGAEIKYRFNWTYPIIISPHDPDNIYVGANVVFKSSTEGHSWEPISPDLTRNDKSKMHLGRLSDFYCTITTMAESKLEKGLIWVGSDDGLVHVTRDGGGHWINATPPEVEPWSLVNIVEPSPHDAAKAYLAVTRYRLDDFKPYIFKTSDYGKTWRLLGEGIAEDAFVRTVREDPKREGLLYAGTETGVYVSMDDGETWDSLQLNLPVVPITDLTVKSDDLVAATQGRAFWILDDLTPLHQLTDEVVSSEAHLFEPRETYRLGGGRRFFGSLPGVGENPPNGVVVRYYFKDKPEDVTLEFLDGQGNLIKSFKGEPTKPEPAGGSARTGRGARPSNAPADAGMNRFVWDMRYPDGRGLRGTDTFLFGGNLRGPLAVPGTYEVRLTAGAYTSTRSFEINKDPRLTSTTEDFEEQFDFLIKIRDAVSVAHDGASRILSMRKQIEERTKEAGNESLVAEAKQVDERLATVLGKLVELRFRGIDDQMLVYPLQLNAAIASLQRVAASADRAPTEQALEVFKLRSAELDAELAELEEIVGQDVSQLNRSLKQSGLEEVSTKLPEDK